MSCEHNGFHSIAATYDRRRGVLVYSWSCDSCGTRLGEVGRAPYKPSFDPRGNARYLRAAALR
jgi:hypothetical protein